MGWNVETQLISYGVFGDKLSPRPGEWQLRSGYNNKDSAKKEAAMWRAKKNGRRRQYHVRIVQD